MLFRQLGAAVGYQMCGGWAECITSPVQVSTLGTSVRQIAAGAWHTCATTNDGSAWCWGRNTAGQVGDGTTDGEACGSGAGGPGPDRCRVTPVRIAALGTNVAEVAAAEWGSCALLKDNSLWCWGVNGNGELGSDTIALGAIVPSPVRIDALGNQVIDVALGNYHACALLVDGSVLCWGKNRFGQIGDGTTGGTTCGYDNCRRSPVPAKLCISGDAGSDN